MAAATARITPGTSSVGRKWIEHYIRESAPSEREAEDAIESFLDLLCYAINVKGAPLDIWHGDPGATASAISLLYKNREVGIWRMRRPPGFE